MNFQGRLTDSSNNPLSGPHDFIFGAYDAPSGGTQLWTETQNGITVANGVLAAQLGSAAPIPAGIFSAAAVYLQITVDGTALTPRQRLATAPYAFNASSLQGRDYAAFVSTDSAAQTIAGEKTFTGTLAAPQLRLSGNVYVSSEALASLGGGVRISTNIYIVGFSSAAKYYGDGSALTGINASGAITSSGQITDGIITLAKLNQSGCAANEIPKWNGSAWACAPDAGGAGSTYTADEASLHLTGSVFSALASSVTLQGNSFNGAGQLARLDAAGDLPAGVKAQAIKTGAYLNDVRVSSAVYAEGAASAATVTNGVYTTGSYSDPAWLTSLGTSKINLSTVTAALGAKLDNNVPVPQDLINLSTVTTALAGKLDNTVSVPQGLINLSTVTAALAGKLDTGAQAASVANGVYATGSYNDPAWITGLATSKISLSTVTAALSGKLDNTVSVPQNLVNLSTVTAAFDTMQATISTAVYTTNAYDDPAWITSIATGKISLSTVTAALAGKLDNTVTVPQSLINLSTVTTALAGKLDTGAQAASVANGVYTTGSYSDPSWITGLATSKISLSTVTAAFGAMQATISTAVYTTSTYDDPAWLASLATSKISLSTVTAALAGKLDNTVTVPQSLINLSTVTTALAGKLDTGAQAASVANGVYTNGSYSDPSWITSLATSKISLSTVTAALGGKLDNTVSVPQDLINLSTVTAALAGKLDTGAQAASVANGVYTNGSYSDPSWITSLATSKISLSTVTAAFGTMQATISTAVYTTSTYDDPAWLSSLATSKISLSTVTAALAGKLDNTVSVPQNLVNLSTVTTALAGKLDTGAQAASVANGVYTTGSYSDPAWITGLSTSKISLSTVTAAFGTMQATISTAVYTTSTYDDPAWITSIATGKISLSTVTAALAGKLDNAVSVPQNLVNLSTVTTALSGKLDTGAQAASVANGVYTTGSYSDPSWITGLATSKISLSTVTAAIATVQATVSTAVYTTGSYSDPAWITSLSGAKIAGAVVLSATQTFTGANAFLSSITVSGNGGNYGLVVSSGVSLSGLLYTNNGNLGIGTENPGAKLEVAGAVKLKSDGTNTGELKVGYTGNTPAGYYATFAPDSGNATAGYYATYAP